MNENVISSIAEISGINPKQTMANAKSKWKKGAHHCIVHSSLSCSMSVFDRSLFVRVILVGWQQMRIFFSSFFFMFRVVSSATISFIYLSSYEQTTIYAI